MSDIHFHIFPDTVMNIVPICVMFFPHFPSSAKCYYFCSDLKENYCDVVSSVHVILCCMCGSFTREVVCYTSHQKLRKAKKFVLKQLFFCMIGLFMNMAILKKNVPSIDKLYIATQSSQ